jgi:hypothetical protein
MALSYDVKENKNAFREISKEEFNEVKSKSSLFGCPKFEEDGKYYEMTLECNMLIFILGLVIGIPKLTEENYEIVFNRINIMEQVNGSWMKQINPKTRREEEYPFTLEIVKENIGISTNGISFSKSDFQKKIIDNIVASREI